MLRYASLFRGTRDPVDRDFFGVLMLNLCTIFTQHRYKMISRISTAVAEDNFQHFLIIRTFLLPPLGSSFPLGLGGSDLPEVASVISSSCQGLLWSSLQTNLTLGKDPPVLGAETLQRLTAEKCQISRGVHKKMWLDKKKCKNL